MKMQVPFYAQKWDVAEWKLLGFQSHEDAAYWEKSSCGILCIKMAMDAFLLEQGRPVSPSASHLIKEGVAMNAYEDATGWNHGGLAALAGRYGFAAENREGVRPDDVRRFLDSKTFSIVSIKWAFKTVRSFKEKILFWKRYGGHLALVVGYESEGSGVKGFYVHHTSIRREYNWRYRFVPVEEFVKGFTGRCILVRTPMVKGSYTSE